MTRPSPYPAFLIAELLSIRACHKLREWVIFFSVFATANSPARAADSSAGDDDDTIFVYGKRRESERISRPGQSIRITPTEASRFETGTHLRQQSAVVTTETGRMSASGFIVPRVRGQETKLTEVFFDNVILQDPYSGLPIVEDIDLKAFGELDLDVGLGPPNVPSLNPFATMRYRLHLPRQSQQSIGSSYGKPFGFSQWLLSDFADSQKKSVWNARIYARNYFTDGSYPYYSDNGTPYNSADDQILWRQNNDARSRQLLPFLQYKTARDEIRFLGWLQQGERGLPTLSPTIESEAREKTTSHLASLSWRHNLTSKNIFLPDAVAFSASQNGDQRQTADPTEAILTGTQDDHYTIETQRSGIRIDYAEPQWTSSSGLEYAEAKVQSDPGGNNTVAVARDVTLFFSGLKIEPTPNLQGLNIEAKILGREFHDRLLTVPVSDELAEQSDSRSIFWGKAIGGGVAYESDFWQIYTQIALSERPPALLEEFGDGGTIRGNASLPPEKNRHQEIGVSVNTNFLQSRVGGAVFQDTTTDKIIFIPSSVNALKAQNIATTQVRGTDIQIESHLQHTSARLGFSKMNPLDRSAPNNIKQLPGVPTTVATGEITQILGQFTLRWASRYHDTVYRDQANTIAIPPVLIHDAYIDAQLGFKKITCQLGLAVTNVADTKKVPISAPGTPGNHGYTGYSDLTGQPLPGRAWTMSAAATF